MSMASALVKGFKWRPLYTIVHDHIPTIVDSYYILGVPCLGSSFLSGDLAF